MAAVRFVVLQVTLMLLMFWSFNNSLFTAEAQEPVMTNSQYCQPSCGKVSIPYPFGMKAGCYLEERFKIRCSSAVRSVPILSVNGINLEVTEISVNRSTLTVNFPIVFANCEGKKKNSSKILIDLEGTPFAFSGAYSYFYARGCDKVVLTIEKDQEASVDSCVSFCDKGSGHGPDRTGCSNVTWFQTYIPSDLKVFNLTFEGYDDNGKLGSSRKSEECRYAYLVDVDWMDQRAGDYESSKDINNAFNVRDRDYVPAVINWGIDTEKFKFLLKNEGCDISSYNPRCSAKGPPINSSSRSKSIQCYSQPGLEDQNPYLHGFCEGNGKQTKIEGIGIGVGLGTVSLLLGLLSLYKLLERLRKEKVKKKFFKRNGGLLLQEQLSSGEVNVEKIKMFPSKELERATDHYNVNRMLGQGGQGTVYKGMLADGKIVAVKKSKILDEAKVKQFINEVVILSQINHRNVVKLLGCCLETEVPLLVYDFIPNGTLFQFLHDPNEELPLTWEMRLRIATDVAGALFYLHSAASIPIYHRDIKSTNILLDEKYRARVADFGTSRSVTLEQTHVTTRVQGTFGYLDPEYFQSSQFTDKSDVYSFGVVLVELLTGKKPVSFTRLEEEATSLVTYFLMAMESNRLFDVLDPQVVKQGKREDVFTVASLARSCLRLNGKERPTMKEVTMVLEGIRKSHFIVTQEIQIDQNEGTVARWDLACTSTNSGLDICDVASQDSQPLIHTY